MPKLSIETDGLTTEKRTVEGFDSIRLAGVGRVVVHQTGTESVEVRAPHRLMSRIETSVRNGTLYLGLKRPTFMLFGIRKFGNIEFAVDAKEVKGLNVSGAGRMDTGPLRAENLDISISGVGKIDTESIDTETLKISVGGCGQVNSRNVDAGVARISGSGAAKVRLDELAIDELKLSISGSGKMHASGHAESVEGTISGSGSLDLDRLETSRFRARISGIGSIRAWVRDKLEATISGSGSVLYRGDPKVSSKTSGSGKVRRINHA